MALRSPDMNFNDMHYIPNQASLTILIQNAMAYYISPENK